MRTALLSITLLAAPAAAQGIAFYSPDNVTTTGNCNVVPWGSPFPNFINQRYQMVVPAADLNATSGFITGLGFAPCATGIHTSTELRITLAHVPPGFSFATSTDFDQNLHVHGSNATVVLDRDNYSWEKTMDTWSSVGLDQSFPYNGTDDLLVEILVVGGAGTNANNSGRTGNRQRLYALNWTGTPPTTGVARATGAAKIQVQMGCADLTTYGLGCHGLELDFSGSAALGAVLNVEASGGAATQPIVLNIGTIGTTPFPIDLASVGFPGCSVWHSSETNVPGITDAAGDHTVSLNVPNSNPLTGARLFFQFVHLNPTVPVGAAVSNGGRAVFGPICP